MKNIIVILCFIILSYTTFAQVMNPGGSGTNGSNGFFISPQGNHLPYNPNSPTGPEGPSGPQSDLDRGVFWLHGLAGNYDALTDAADATQHGGATNFPPNGYKVNSHTTGLTYPETSTTLIAAQQVRNFMDKVASNQRTNGVNPKKNILVAHSQGGLVSQALLYKDYCFDPNINGPNYGGIVTFGSSHKGAMILDNSDKLINWLESGCNDLTDGPALEFNNGFLGGLLNTFIDDNKLPYKGVKKEELCQKIIKNLNKSLDLLKPITNDYKVQSNDGVLEKYKECIVENSGEIAKVAFYGIEPPVDLPWRTLDWMLVRNVNDVDKFQANDDKVLVDSIRKLRAFYVKKVIEKEIEISDLSLKFGMPCNWYMWFYFRFYCLLYDHRYYEAIEERTKYQNGIKWFDAANDKWAEIIGALTVEKKTKHFCHCYDKFTGQESIDEIKSPSDCFANPGPGKVCYPETQQYFEKSYKPSDGIVLAESASEFPGATSLSVGAPSRELSNSSHMQMRNDDNTRAKLKLLMEGKYGDFFITKTR